MAMRGGGEEARSRPPDRRVPERSGRTPWTARAYLVCTIVIALLVLTGATAYAFVWSTNHARATAQDSMTFRAQRAAHHIDSGVSLARDTVRNVAEQPGIDAVFKDSDGCQLTASGSAAFASVRLDIVAPNGDVVCSSEPEVTTRHAVHAGSDWLGEAMREGTHVRWGGHDAVVDGGTAVVVSSAVQRGNQVVGSVVAFLHLGTVASDVARDLEGVRGTAFALVDRADGRVLSSSLAKADLSRPFPVTDRTDERPGLDGIRRIYGSSDVPGSTLRVYAGVDRVGVLSQARGSLDQLANHFRRFTAHRR